MDYDKLIEELNNWNEQHLSVVCGGKHFACDYLCENEDCIVVRAATALSTLQAENEQLRALVDGWKKKYVEANGKWIAAENKWDGLDKAVRNGSVYRPMQEELNLTHEENQSLKDANEKLRAELNDLKEKWDKYQPREHWETLNELCENLHDELEQVKAKRDAAISDLTWIARTYPVELCDDLVCQYCKHYPNVNTGCPGWTENDCFEWRGPQKEE